MNKLTLWIRSRVFFVFFLKSGLGPAVMTSSERFPSAKRRSVWKHKVRHSLWTFPLSCCLSQSWYRHSAQNHPQWLNRSHESGFPSLHHHPFANSPKDSISLPWIDWNTSSCPSWVFPPHSRDAQYGGYIIWLQNALHCLLISLK